ncbi:hypothetical protein VE00_04293 [Pseudogymnoascus sp. WSF 3629]|nr:hypothetical protein VE00_04293 [Pseudogymnoascus sp. WSF 3629]
MSIVQPEVFDIVNGASVVQNTSANLPFESITESIEAFARGEFVIVLDNDSRENEGDLIIATEDLTTEKMAFMIRYTSGYICAAILESRATSLDLPKMVNKTADPYRIAYTITIDALGLGPYHLQFRRVFDVQVIYFHSVLLMAELERDLVILRRQWNSADLLVSSLPLHYAR